jgi:Flp pilus assembly protein TadD
VTEVEREEHNRGTWLIVGLFLLGLIAVSYFVFAGLAGDPQAAQEHLMAGKDSLSRGDAAAAVQELENAAHKDPTSKEIQFNLGLAYTQVGRYREAAQAFETALTLGADVNTHSNLGVVYYKMGRLEDAVAQYQEALNLKPNDAEVRSNLAAAYLQLGRLEDAQAEYERALALSPGLAEAHYGLGMAYAAKGEKQKAIEALQQFLELDTGRDPLARSEAEKQLQALRSATE